MNPVYRNDNPEIPVSDPKEALHPTALKVLLAAKRIIETKGLNAATLEAIAEEAGVNKAATRYYFGDKAGLLMAIVDEIVLDECASITADIDESMDDRQRVASFVENINRIATDVESFGGYFDILPHAIREPHLRARLVALYEFWYEWNLKWLGLRRGGNEKAGPRLRALGQFTAALADGIAIQAEIHGKSYDPTPVLGMLEEFLADELPRLESDAGGRTVASPPRS